MTLSISDDGYIRMSLSQLLAIEITHLVSGLDESAPEHFDSEATPTEITGYTEWISTGEPVITLGWDWQMRVHEARVSLFLLHEPYSNLMLVDERRVDLGPSRSASLITNYIGTIPWQDTVAECIHQRYRH